MLALAFINKILLNRIECEDMKIDLAFHFNEQRCVCVLHFVFNVNLIPIPNQTIILKFSANCSKHLNNKYTQSNDVWI